MKFLIVDDEVLIRQFCCLVIENNFENSIVVEAANSRDAIKLCQEHKDFTMVITDYEMPGGNGDLLINHIADSKMKTKVVVHTSRAIGELPVVEEFLKSNSNGLYVQKPTRFKEFSNKVKTLLDYSNSSEYRRIKIAYFFRYNKALCDIYLSLNNEKFLKIIHSGEHYQKSDIDKYIDKNLKYLYVKLDDIEGFADTIGATPFLQFENNSLAVDDIEENLIRIHYVLKDLITSVGVDATAVNIAESYIKNINNLSQDNSKITDMLYKLRKQADYLYEHSFLTACLASFILKQLSWSNQSMIEKICYASLFHDIALDNSEIALIHDLKNSEMRKFSIEEITAFRNHPKAACEIIKGPEVFDQDVENIILSHHEVEDGTGFPRKLNGKNIRPLSCVFILAHEFVRLMYIQNFDERSHKDILTLLFNTYGTGNFKEILDALYKTLLLNPIFEED